MNPLPLALAALLPVMVGPVSAPPGQTLTMQLCNGGTISIPVGGDKPVPERDCHPKGCHAGTCRERTAVKHPKRTN
jgi:hypothetical protein